jgi:hypothetical protein
MSVSSSSIRAAGTARDAGVPDRGLRRLRRLCLAVAVACAVLLPFELGIVRSPDLSAIDLSGLPLVGKYFPEPAPFVLHNSLRTVVVGSDEHFSIRLPNEPNATLTYVLRYPNGHIVRATVRANARGISSYTFPIPYRPHHFREVATISVRDAAGKLLAVTRFAIQQAR